MTLDAYRKLSYDEQKHIKEIFHNWLKDYTDEVIKKVIRRFTEIITDDFTMQLIEELYIREQKEIKDEIDTIGLLLDYESEKEQGIFLQLDWDTIRVHCHPLTHSNSYRDILYDRYIREEN